MPDVAIFDTLQTLRQASLTSTSVTAVEVRGHSAVNDGGGGRFGFLKIYGTPPAGVDNNGWHILTNEGQLWGRVSDVNLPQQWGAYPSETINQHAAMQKFLDFWSNPWSFIGFRERPQRMQTSFRSEVPAGNDANPLTQAPHGNYRCDDTLNVILPDLGGNYYKGQAPGELIFHGQVLTPNSVRKPAFKVVDLRSYSKPRIFLRCRKERNSGYVPWNDTATYPYPDVFDNDETYRTWSNGLSVFRNERLRADINGAIYLYDVHNDGWGGAADHFECARRDVDQWECQLDLPGEGS